MKKEDVKSFILYHDLLEPLMMLSIKERGEWISAVFAYETGCREMMPPRLSAKAEMLFSIVMQALDRNREAYTQKCERRATNGRLGGRPKRQNELNDDAEKTKWFSEKAKKPYNGNDNENDNQNDNVNKNDSGGGNGNENEALPPIGDSGEFSTSPESGDAPTATDNQPSLSREESVRIFREMPVEYRRSRLDRAEAYAEEHDLTVTQVLLSWWLRDREEWSG